MIDTENQNLRFLNHSHEYFSNLQYQHDDPDKFTAIRRNVISFVEDGPQKSCETGWTYDHSLVFNTITSEVKTIFQIFVYFLYYSNIVHFVE